MFAVRTNPPSTRRVTQETGNFTRATEGSRSLERGLLLLRAFRIGSSNLTNAELAKRTGIPRPTVSRLTKSLVDSGFLVYDVEERAYRLGSIVLSLADTFRLAHQATEIALPLMREVAQEHQINIGLAVADQTEMVYLLAIRHSPDSVSRLRRVAPGARIPIEQTAVGIAYLEALPPTVRQAVLGDIGLRVGPYWKQECPRLEAAITQVHKRGYSSASFIPGNMAVGRTFSGPDHQLYAMNISFEPRPGQEEKEVRHYASVLKKLIDRIGKEWR